MGRTKKVGIAGRFGARYGSTIRKRIRNIEEKMKRPHKCPKCETKAVKRVSVGIWECKKCGAKFTGGAYEMKTAVGGDSVRITNRIRLQLKQRAEEL